MAEVPSPLPKLMAVGDSLAQGCRSLSVNGRFCSQSWPARVAEAQGWRFSTPDFRRPVLFDLEDEIRRLDARVIAVAGLRLREFEARLRDNLGAWLADARESAADCFDNLALAGAEVHDLYTRTAATSAARIADLTPQGKDSRLTEDGVADLHLAVNGRFTLNPSQAPEFAGYTPLDWVRARRPETLVVQVGHNHGLYAVGSKAEDGPIDAGHPVHGDYWAQWGRLAGELAALPPEVRTILVCLLPKVGAVANLRPRGVERVDGYAETYEPVFSPSLGVLSGPQLAAVDARIRAANDRTRDVVLGASAGSAGRVKFLDVYALFDGYDYKNTLDPGRRVAVAPGLSADNRYVDSAFNLPRPFGPGGRRLVAGGLLSVDGMHPSGCGYALIAAEALAALGLGHDRAGLLARGFAGDPLLTDSPLELEVVVGLLAAYRRARRLNLVVEDRHTFLSGDLDLADALRMMRRVFSRSD